MAKIKQEISGKIWLVLALALSIRALLPVLGYFVTRNGAIFYTPDTESYLLPAKQLIAHDRFFANGSPQAAVWNTPVKPGPDTVRTPGYPLLLTIGLFLGRPATITIALQILLSCFTVYMTFRTALLLFESERIALVCAAFYAVEPLSILFSSLLAPETLFNAILMVAMYFLVRYLKQQSLGDLIISGVAVAVSLYVRPASYFLPLVIVFAILAASAIRTLEVNRRRLIAHLAAFILVFVGITGLWQIRNYAAVGYSGFSSVFSEDMYCCMAASVLAAQHHLSYRRMEDGMGCYDLSVYFRDHPRQMTWPRAKRYDYMEQASERILLASPFTYAQIYFSGVLRQVFDPGSTEYLRFFGLYPNDRGLLHVALNQGIVKTLEALLSDRLLASTTGALLIVQLTFIACACMALSRHTLKDPAILAELLIMLYFLTFPGGPAAWGRFRFPAMPIMSCFAGYGLMRALDRLPESGR